MTNALRARYDENRRDLSNAVEGNQRKLGSVRIIGGSALAPMVRPMSGPMLPPIVPPLGRRMGETTIDRRRAGFWAGTPLERVSATVGDPTMVHDVDLGGVSEIGVVWDLKGDKVFLSVSTERGVYRVAVNGDAVRGCLRRAWEIAYSSPVPLRVLRALRGGSLEGALRQVDALVRESERAKVAGFDLFKPDTWVAGVEKAVNDIGTGVGKFFKNPGKWIETAAKDVVRVAGDVVTKVVSSDVFGAVMGGLAVIPPLQAIGGAGLAAFGVAKTAKKVIEGADAVIKGVQPKKKPKPRGATRQAAAFLPPRLKAKPPAKKRPTSKAEAKRDLEELARMIGKVSRDNAPFSKMVTAALKGLPF